MVGQPPASPSRPIQEFFIELVLEIIYSGTVRTIAFLFVGAPALVGYYLFSSGWSPLAAIAVAGLIAVVALAGLLMVVVFIALLVYRRRRANSKRT